MLPWGLGKPRGLAGELHEPWAAPWPRHLLGACGSCALPGKPFILSQTVNTPLPVMPGCTRSDNECSWPQRDPQEGVHSSDQAGSRISREMGVS